MEFREFSSKTVDDAVTEACQALGVTSQNLNYEVITEGSTGFLGIGSKPAIIKVAIKAAEVSPVDVAKKFLNELFAAMNLVVVITTSYDENDRVLDVELSGDEMGVLIGKRGSTLDSVQYLLSLVVNKDAEEYIRVKVDTENYRARRKETLESLAKNVSFKVKRSGRPYTFEPMNPYERRIIHSALQNDKFVTTYSEGEEPNRCVVVKMKEDAPKYEDRKNRRKY